MRSFRKGSVSYGRTPEPVTPYQKAAQVWDERIGSARVQARNWRLMAFGSLLLSLALAVGLATTAGRSPVVPYVIEVDALGEARAIGPANAAHAPRDSQIAWHLAEFVKNFRSLPIDPVVLRSNWLEAYAYVTDRGAGRLDEHARSNDPFGAIGDRTIVVEMTSAVRSSETSFELRWKEHVSLRGSSEETRHYTATVSYVLRPPKDEEMLRANPLGIYIHEFHWSRDLVSGETS